MKRMIVLALVALLGACAAPVVPQRDGTYVLNWQFNDLEPRENYELYYREVMEKTCPGGVELLDETVRHDPYLLGWGGSEVVWHFRCLRTHAHRAQP